MIIRMMVLVPEKKTSGLTWSRKLFLIEELIGMERRMLFCCLFLFLAKRGATL